MLPTPTTRRWSISATLSGLRRPARTCASAGPAKLVGERLETEAGEPRMRAEPGGRGEVEHAEAARVDEAQAGAVVEAEGQMLVRAGRRPVEQQAPRHAEVEQERVAVVERDQDVLGAAREALDPAPDQALGRRAGSGKRRSGRRCSRLVMRRATRRAASPRMMVSTSGSSGMLAPSRWRAGRALVPAPALP